VTAALPLQVRQYDRLARDRLELLTALINGPAFDPLLRPDLIRIPRDHPVYTWACAVAGCARPRTTFRDLCGQHQLQWTARPAGMDRAEFLRTTTPLNPTTSFTQGPCRICPGRPATSRPLQLCARHRSALRRKDPAVTFEEWLAAQTACVSYGECRAASCPELACSPLGLCFGHECCYRNDRRPGRAVLPQKWFQIYEYHGLETPVLYQDKNAFEQWCSQVDPLLRAGYINLRGLRPLVKAEIKWGLFAHGQQRHYTNWNLNWIYWLANDCRGLDCLADLDTSSSRRPARLIALEMLYHLRIVYSTPADSREAGFIDGRHFGFTFARRRGYYDLTGVSQRWLRDLLWDAMETKMRSPRGGRSASPYDHLRRAALELSAFLEADAPAGGHKPALLREEHMQRFVADQRQRALNALPALGVRLKGGPTTVTETTRRFTFNYARMILRPLLETTAAEAIGLDRAFITTLPSGGFSRGRTRSPFSDEVAQALASEANLERLAAEYDPHDRGLRDIWETMIVSGRRSGEVIGLRLECIGRHNRLALLWHDQTKVNQFDEAVRIPDYTYDRLRERQRKTIALFEGRTGRVPTAAERARMALFPTRIRNPRGERPISSQWFGGQFRAWVAELDLGSCVPHQARHTLATRLLAAGAGLHHIRRFLGHVSIAMTEHYAKVALSEIEDVLQQVWVAGPGAPRPGELLSAGTTGMTPDQAQALAIDLSRRSTPAEGGFCTFQPVINGGACPWNLDCENCDKFVMSGADLLYWRRKREQWMSIAERAPDDATADYLHKVFEPTATAIDGLEKALAALGLLQDALALDMRRPQDYFDRVWSTSFRARDLASSHDHDGLAAAEASA
jgi:integrase